MVELVVNEEWLELIETDEEGVKTCLVKFNPVLAEPDIREAIEVLAHWRGWGSWKDTRTGKEYDSATGKEIKPPPPPPEPKPPRQYHQIVQRLKELGKTKAWLAEQVGCSPRMLDQHISGKKPLSDLNIKRVATQLEVSKEFILGLPEKPVKKKGGNKYKPKFTSIHKDHIIYKKLAQKNKNIAWLARQLNVSSSAIYSHISSKSHLLPIHFQKLLRVLEIDGLNEYYGTYNYAKQYRTDAINDVKGE